MRNLYKKIEDMRVDDSVRFPDGHCRKVEAVARDAYSVQLILGPEPRERDGEHLTYCGVVGTLVPTGHNFDTPPRALREAVARAMVLAMRHHDAWDNLSPGNRDELLSRVGGWLTGYCDITEIVEGWPGADPSEVARAGRAVAESLCWSAPGFLLELVGEYTPAPRDAG